MKKKPDWGRLVLAAVQAGLMVIWFRCISRFELYSVNGDRFNKFDGLYLICMALAVLGMAEGALRPRRLTRRESVVAGLAAGVYGLATVLANYPAFDQAPLEAALSLAGGFCVGWQIVGLGIRRLPLMVKPRGCSHPKRVFWGSFGVIWAVYLLYFFFAAYPGLFSRDSFSAVAQCVTGRYDNTSPFWHTMVVKLCLEAGGLLGLDMSGSVGIYAVLQSMAMAAAFAYVLVTLYQAGMPRWCLAPVAAVYGLAAYNIAYSVTLWKDIPFSLGALTMVTALYRILKGLGSSKRNAAVFTVGSLFFCLMRTNGLYACLVLTLVLVPSVRRLGKRLLVILCAVLAVGWLCNGPVLDALEVPDTDFVEALAIPFQQVTRVVAEGEAVSEADLALLEEIFDLEQVKALHDPLSVNNMKFEAFRRDRQDYLRENLGTYAGLWLRLGVQHPWTYLKAWVDETVGYWNAGYNYWIWPEPDLDAQRGAELGIVRPALENPVKEAFAGLFHVQQRLPLVAQPLFGIGFQVWILLLCMILCAVKGREEWYLGLPTLVILLGLWVGTPVFAEFRYAYPVFVTVPLVLPLTVFRAEKGVPKISGDIPGNAS
ncbi:MAG: DUF6020 family protein [Eubacteriales bacterium]|nr:DUF6020 family protein [Eubacteriales bacterium]